ncbi:MAG: 1-deoxy-D-xylulose-5-phosphate synthase [Clostridia bacterium]|nr:1-deoxy-D-xylulose-5-phosphate synthase [Clostridia bacterium]
MDPNQTTYLDSINSAADLRALPRKAIPALNREIRSFLVEKVSEHGGHLASNLGVVELTVALHRVFNTPSDRIIFDVGHQSYVHKMLTGRRDRFESLRTVGGLSGFPGRNESEYDAFGTGHSSTALSAALGFAAADKLAGRNNFTVAVVGDGAFTGGMVHEALNNCDPDMRLILILNENEMSISKNIGRFANYLARIRASGGYGDTKRNTKRFLLRLPLLGKPLYRLLRRFKRRVKNTLYGSNLFEEVGLHYMGPVDGNDYNLVERLLCSAKRQARSTVIHIKTQKGKGCAAAEHRPTEYHNIAASHGASVRFPTVFGETLTELAKENTDICAITAAMADGTGLVPFSAAYPDRFFDVGIAEGHAVTFAAGLAAAGMRPYAAIYSTFLQRAYDSLLHDVALQNLPVSIFIDRAGLAPSDGATHHGIFDVAFLSHIPNFTILTPATYGSLRAMMKDSLAIRTPLAIRYPNAAESDAVVSTYYPNGEYESYGMRADFTLADTPHAVIVTYGTTASRVLAAKEHLTALHYSVGTVLLERLTPYADVAARLYALLPPTVKTVVFLEEGIYNGGAAMLLTDAMRVMDAKNGGALRFRTLAIRDSFVSPTVPCDIYEYAGISTTDLINAVIEELS